MQELRVIANNIANASTVGYKRESSVFTEYVSSRAGSESISMGSLQGHFPVLDDGAFVKTGNTLDVALGGDGMFAVDTQDGVMLTRNGQFQLDAEGTLISNEGYPVLDEGGGTIAVPPETVNIAIGPDGTISFDNIAANRLGVFSAPVETLERAGNNLWRATEGYEIVDEPTIQQGFVEQSNVDPVLEMARLIEAQRAFEAGQNLLETNSERQSNLIRTLGQNS